MRIQIVCIRCCWPTVRAVYLHLCSGGGGGGADSGESIQSPPTNAAATAAERLMYAQQTGRQIHPTAAAFLYKFIYKSNACRCCSCALAEIANGALLLVSTKCPELDETLKEIIFPALLLIAQSHRDLNEGEF